jgi:hypothetical protein
MITREEVYNSLQEEIKNIKIVQDKQIESEKDLEDFEEWREPLSIEKQTIVKILLSWGGGEDGYKLYFDDEKNLIKGIYYKADWGEYQEVELNEEELNLIFDVYLYGDFPQDKDKY